MFIGEHFHALDDKGRLTLPKKYRDRLREEGLMITKGEDFCLQIYTRPAWERKQAEVERLSTASAKNREYRRVFYSSSEDAEIDKAGRILVNKSLKSYAGLSKEVAVVGAGEFVEVWDVAQWDLQLQAADAALGTRDAEAGVSDGGVSR